MCVYENNSYDAIKRAVILNPATHNKKHFKQRHRLTVKKERKKSNNKNVLICCMIQY